jgi:hypothetical protein
MYPRGGLKPPYSSERLEAVYCSSLDRDEEHVRRAAKIVASELWVARTWALWAGVMQGLVMRNDFC